jgi:hypothetical protein
MYVSIGAAIFGLLLVLAFGFFILADTTFALLVAAVVTVVVAALVEEEEEFASLGKTASRGTCFARFLGDGAKDGGRSSFRIFDVLLFSGASSGNSGGGFERSMSFFLRLLAICFSFAKAAERGAPSTCMGSTETG